MDSMLTLYAIPILGAAVIFIGFYIFDLKKKKRIKQAQESKKEEKKEASEGESVEAIVYDVKTRTFGPETISAGDIIKIQKTVRCVYTDKQGNKIEETFGTLGRIVKDDDDGKDYYSLIRKLDGSLIPVEIPETMEYPPDMLYTCFMVKYPVGIVYNVMLPKDFMGKWGHIVMVAVVSLAAVFLLVAQR